MIGIAINEGYINSVNDLVVKYIPELKKKIGYWNKLTIEHLLNMRSGLNYQNGYSIKLPYFGIGQLYTSKNALRIIKDAEYSHPPILPGTQFYYSSLDNQILGIILQRATNRSLSELLEEKIWKKIGMQQTAKWSIDSKRRQNIKSYCCMMVSPLDYARFARLYLHSGNWNGNSIVPKEWVKKSIVPKSLSEYYKYKRNPLGYYQ